MKTTSKLITGMLVLASLAACSDNEINENEKGNEEKASITVTLKGETLASSKATGNSATIDDETDERKIVNFKVYVFNYSNGSLEKSVDGVVTDGVAETTLVDGLNTAGTKRVVVVANVPAGFPTINNYANFETATFDLGLQDPANRATTGLVMSGESGQLTLTGATDPDPVSVSIKRVVAKIELGSITITPDPGHTAPFVLTGVSIQKAKSSANIGPVTIISNGPLYGGYAGTESLVPTPNYLADAISTDADNGSPKTFDNFFYVFPNEDDETLMTIIGTYNGSTTYFPFRINMVAGEQNADGTLIKRNTRYILNVTLKELGNGTTDPDFPTDPAAIDVTITTEGWEGPLTQDVEW